MCHRPKPPKPNTKDQHNAVNKNVPDPESIRKVEHLDTFIVGSVQPDNGPFFEERSNPLSSKGDCKQEI